MFYRLVIGTALFAVIISSSAVTQAQDSTSKLTFLSSDPLKDNEILNFTNEDGKELHSTKWPSGLSLYREFTLPSGEYKINLPDIRSSFSIETSDKAPTFLQIDKYSEDNIEKGVQITIWQGQANSAAKSTINEIKKFGFTEGLTPVSLGHFGSILNFNTQPPWPIPPRPPKP